MNRTAIILFLALATLGGSGLCAQSPTPAGAQQPQSEAAADTAPQELKVMREFRGLKLGLKPEEVHALMGQPERTGMTWEECQISAGDLLTVHYQQGAVRTIHHSQPVRVSDPEVDCFVHAGQDRFSQVLHRRPDAKGSIGH
jgi:hypothetical protein